MKIKYLNFIKPNWIFGQQINLEYFCDLKMNINIQKTMFVIIRIYLEINKNGHKYKVYKTI